MKKAIYSAIWISAIILLTGCASTYRKINPEMVSYANNDLADGIGFSYRYNILRENNNKKYAKKADDYGVKLVAVKLTNYTDTTLNVKDDMQFYYGDQPVLLMEPVQIAATIRQSTSGYLFYLLLTFTNLTVTTNGHTQYYPIGLALGPGITAANVAVAGHANKKFLADLSNYNILDKEISKGETMYGIIGIRGASYERISVRLKQ